MAKLTGSSMCASGVALLLLAALVGLGAVVVLPSDEHRWPLAMACYAILVPMALWAWSGEIFRRKGSAESVPRTWRDWVEVFFGSLCLSTVFVLIDVAIGHPGLSLIFTAGAVSMTLIALPGAARAWLLDVSKARTSRPDVPD